MGRQPGFNIPGPGKVFKGYLPVTFVSMKELQASIKKISLSQIGPSHLQGIYLEFLLMVVSQQAIF